MCKLICGDFPRLVGGFKAKETTNEASGWKLAWNQFDTGGRLWLAVPNWVAPGFLEAVNDGE